MGENNYIRSDPAEMPNMSGFRPRGTPAFVTPTRSGSGVAGAGVGVRAAWARRNASSNMAAQSLQGRRYISIINASSVLVNDVLA